MNIFIAKKGQRQGPFTESELTARVHGGQILLDDLAWHEGCVGWAPLREMADLLETIIPPIPVEGISTEPPPIPVAPSTGLEFTATISQDQTALEQSIVAQPVQESQSVTGKKQTQPMDWVRTTIVALILMTVVLIAPFYIFLIVLCAAIYLAATGKLNRNPKPKIQS
jgi:hypothetical protein